MQRIAKSYEIASEFNQEDDGEGSLRWNVQVINPMVAGSLCLTYRRGVRCQMAEKKVISDSLGSSPFE